MRGWRVKAGVAFGLIACGGVAWFAVRYVVQARDQGTAGTVAQGLAAVLVPVAGLAVWLVRQFRQGVPPIDLAQAADDLAGRVGRQWRDAELQRGLSYRPLAVRWTWSSRGLSGPPGDAVGDARRPRMAPLPGCSRITRRELARGRSQRIVPGLRRSGFRQDSPGRGAWGRQERGDDPAAAGCRQAP
jgi:hypothetical protein